MNTRAIRVLLVEDSPAEVEIIRDILGRYRSPPFQIDHRTRIALAGEALKLSDYDIVLLDMNLPDSTGLDGFRRLQDLHPHVPYVILTNQADEDLAAKAVSLGAQDYLFKQEVDRRSLVRAIRYAIERHGAEERLRISEERYTLAVNGANDCIWDWDLNTDETYFSPRWRQLLGCQGESTCQIDEWFSRVHEDDLEALKTRLNAHLEGETPHFEVEHRIARENSEEIWVLARGVAIRDRQGKPCRMAGSLTDITARKSVEARLLHDALHDSLTGLPNRTLFLDRLALRLRQYRRSTNRLFAVLFFDLDRFKTINDSLGHTVGDHLLCHVGKRLQAFLRPGDTLARLSGDEFAILLDEIDSIGDATLVAERIHRLMASSFSVDEHEIFTSASVGIAPAGPHYRAPEELLRDADLAMYRAKRSPSNHYQVFGQDMHKAVVRQHRLETDLRRAIEHNEFLLHYQPIVSARTGETVGVEALMRWQHPSRGLIYPNDFTAMAEDTGMIVPIGWIVLEEACRQARQWQKMFPSHPPMTMSVNISGRMFRDRHMARHLLDVAEKQDLPPSCLQVEITENATMDHGEVAKAQLSLLQECNVGLHIDDFGTGYSSLTNLRHFAYDTLKIDKSFVQGVHDTGENAAIVKAIIYLGKMLQMNVIAEGVETEAQFRWLKANKCPELQGFWLSKPLEGKSLARYISSGHAEAV